MTKPVKTPRDLIGELLNIDTEYSGVAGDTCLICGFPLDKKTRLKMIDKCLAQLDECYKLQSLSIPSPKINPCIDCVPALEPIDEEEIYRTICRLYLHNKLLSHKPEFDDRMIAHAIAAKFGIKKEG